MSDLHSGCWTELPCTYLTVEDGRVRLEKFEHHEMIPLPITDTSVGEDSSPTCAACSLAGAGAAVCRCSAGQRTALRGETAIGMETALMGILSSMTWRLVAFGVDPQIPPPITAPTMWGSTAALPRIRKRPCKSRR